MRRRIYCKSSMPNATAKRLKKEFRRRKFKLELLTFISIFINKLNMKKILSIVSAIALALPLFAGTVTFKPSDFAGQGTSSTGSQVSATKGGITVECNKAFGASDALRCYKDGVLNITSASNIQTLDFTFQSASGKYYNGGLADGNDLTAQITVNATSWSNTLASQARITELVVTIDGEGVEPETVDTITVSEALARLNDPAGNKGECYVKGKVLSIITNNVETYGNISYWMADTQNPGDSLQAYRMKGAGNTDYASAASVEFVEGDEILVYAAGLAMYHNNNTGQDIPELNTGYYVRTISGADITTLDWSYADATRDNGNWIVTIAASSANNADNMSLVFASAEENGIAGYHSLAAASQVKIGATTTAVTAGYLKLTFRSISNNNYNIYDVEAKAVSGNVAYRILKEIEIAAFDADGDEILLSADRPFTPKANDTITCAQAREYALSLASGESSPMTVTVRGFITDMFSNGVTFWMDDQAGSAKTIQAYSSTMPAGVSLDNGAEVYVTGALKNYNGTPEIDHGTVSVISGGSEIVGQEVTVAEALAAAQALAPNATSEGYYAITGYISGIVTEYSAQYGNISFWMSDAADDAQNFQAYRAKCDASIADKLVVGAKVKVTDKIKHFHQDATEGEDPKPERTVYETNGGGTVILIQGAGVEDINVNAPAVKFIENGRIIILRNGVRYDVQGRIAE